MRWDSTATPPGESIKTLDGVIVNGSGPSKWNVDDNLSTTNERICNNIPQEYINSLEWKSDANKLPSSVVVDPDGKKKIQKQLKCKEGYIFKDDIKNKLTMFYQISGQFTSDGVSNYCYNGTLILKYLV